MHRQLEKRLQMDTESRTNPDTPAIDRSPAAKMQAIQNDGSKPLPPHSRTGLPELTDLGPGNPLTDNAATASETRQVPQTSMPCKSSSTQDTMTAQTIPKHDQKPTTPPTPWTGALECTWPARLPPPALFRDAMLSSRAPPTLPTLPTSPRPTQHTRKTLPIHEHLYTWFNYIRKNEKKDKIWGPLLQIYMPEGTPGRVHRDGQNRVLLVGRAPQPRMLPFHASSLPLPPRHPPRLMVRVKIWNSLAPND